MANGEYLQAPNKDVLDYTYTYLETSQRLGPGLNKYWGPDTRLTQGEQQEKAKVDIAKCEVISDATINIPEFVSVGGQDKTREVVETAQQTLKPGEIRRLTTAQKLSLYKNLTPDVFAEVIMESNKRHAPIGVYETCALLNPKILETKRVLVRAKEPISEQLATHTAQKVILESNGIAISEKSEFEDAKALSEGLKKIVLWGEQNAGNTSLETQGRAVIKEGFIGAKHIKVDGLDEENDSLKDCPVREGFFVSYDNSTDERVIKIQNADATGATVVIELHPSSTIGSAKSINPQVKRAYIQTNDGGQIFELKLEEPDIINDLSNMDAKKVLWLLDTTIPPEVTVSRPKTELDKLESARANLYKEYRDTTTVKTTAELRVLEKNIEQLNIAISAAKDHINSGRDANQNPDEYVPEAHQIAKKTLQLGESLSGYTQRDRDALEKAGYDLGIKTIEGNLTDIDILRRIANNQHETIQKLQKELDILKKDRVSAPETSQDPKVNWPPEVANIMGLPLDEKVTIATSDLRGAFRSIDDLIKEKGLQNDPEVTFILDLYEDALFDKTEESVDFDRTSLVGLKAMFSLLGIKLLG